MPGSALYGPDGGGMGDALPSASLLSRGAQDSLSLAGDKSCTVFVGRIPRRTELASLQAMFVNAGLRPLQIIPSR